MERDSRKVVEEEGLAWGPDTIEAEIRDRIRGMFESIVTEEPEAALGAGRSQRVDARTGYYHGARERQFTTGLGKTTITVPRAQIARYRLQSIAAVLPELSRAHMEPDLAAMMLENLGLFLSELKLEFITTPVQFR